MYLIETRGGEFQLPSLRLAMYYSVPGILYFINNNLSIHLQEEMDPATYQVRQWTMIDDVRAFLFR